MGGGPSVPELSPAQIARVGTATKEGVVDYLPNYKEKFAASVGEHADWDVDKHHKEVQKMMNKDGMKIKPIKQKISRTVGEELRPEIVSEMNEDENVAKLPTSAKNKAVNKALETAVGKSIEDLLKREGTKIMNGEGSAGGSADGGAEDADGAAAAPAAAASDAASDAGASDADDGMDDDANESADGADGADDADEAVVEDAVEAADSASDGS